MKCKNHYFDKITGREYNCGKCSFCRANKASEWKLRCIYELKNWNNAIFLTLTYSDEWLNKYNPNRSLLKKDMQQFKERLKSDLRYQGAKKMPAYFICGEYSPKPKERPHYHLIIFGLRYGTDETKKLIIDNWCPPNALRCEPWQFDYSRGRKCGIQPVTLEDIGYCTDYSSKKLFDKLGEKEYKNKGREPPFKLNSQGLGLATALENSERLISDGFCRIGDKKIAIPKYFRDKLGIGIEIRNSDIDTMRKKKEVEWIVGEYKAQNPNWCLLPLNQQSKNFEWWYDNHLYSLSNCIFKDYEKRTKIYRSDLF